MARKRTKKVAVAPQKVTLMDKVLPLPEQVEGVREIRIELDRKVIELISQVTDELIAVRGLSGRDKPENLTVADPLVILIKNMRKGITAEDAVKLAAAEYGKRVEQVSEDAAVVAMTWHTDTGDWQPEAFEEGEQKPLEEDDTPAWLRSAKLILPEPQRDLNNPYERRLNIIQNILVEAGDDFTRNFKSILDNEMLTRINDFLVSQGVDLSQFQLAGASK